MRTVLALLVGSSLALLGACSSTAEESEYEPIGSAGTSGSGADTGGQPGSGGSSGTGPASGGSTPTGGTGTGGTGTGGTGTGGTGTGGTGTGGTGTGGSATGGGGDAPTYASDKPWKLVWADEFDGSGPLDSANWGYEQGFVRNNELQYYTPDRAAREDGFLVITAQREPVPLKQYKNAAYTSASVITYRKHEFTYGVFEARIKIPTAAGMWPAFWTLGANFYTTGWPACGEVDIMEYYRSMLLANVCIDAGGNCDWRIVTKSLSSLGAGWADQFHVWTMEWDYDRIVLKVDGTVLNSVGLDAAGIGADNEFRRPHYMILNVAIGGNQGGDPSNTVFPQTMMVDWVRVFQVE